LSLAAQTQDGLAITGLLLMVIGASLFTFTLVLHAAALATRRSSVRASNAPRSRSYGEHRPLTPVDRFGVWLRSLAVRRQATSRASASPTSAAASMPGSPAACRCR
jgi:hypothetical protein